jgi:hypothetical protein
VQVRTHPFTPLEPNMNVILPLSENCIEFPILVGYKKTGRKTDGEPNWEGGTTWSTD